MTKLRHYDHLGTARFVTFCCYHRYQLLNHEYARISLIENLEQIRREEGIKIYDYVIMPEHIHLVLHPPDRVELGKVIGRFKGRVSRSVLQWMRLRQTGNLTRLRAIRNNREVYAFWQRRCYDHNCRTQETTLEKIEYCHKNPVRSGLVSHPSEWCWSSYNWHAGDEDSPIEVDGIRI
jgi:putative transposase